MTMPNGAAGVNPDVPFKITGNDGSISGLTERTRENVEQELLDIYAPSGTLPGWAGKPIKPTSVDGFDASKVVSGEFDDSFLPSVGELRDAIYQAFTDTSLTGRTAADVKTAIETWMALVEGRLDALETP